MSLPNLRAPLSLLVAATTWGLLWYPYRLLEAKGISGSLASLITYLLGMGLVFLWYRGRLRLTGFSYGGLIAVALATGWTNLAYVLAVIQGEIMRVLLLFYLAPLWTIPFAWLLLRERPNAWAWLLIALSITGAWIMLADGRGLPWPGNVAEWLGLSAGVGFALSNVLSRRLHNVPAETRAVWIFAGVALIALPPLSFESGGLTATLALRPADWGLLLFTGALLVLATLTVQYGLVRISANRAIVILLMELVVAAFASWLLAGEVMSAREWWGGALIVAASLLSGKVEEKSHG
jgi:drug/metabolite transporter (DMT)-like permease